MKRALAVALVVLGGCGGEPTAPPPPPVLSVHVPAGAARPDFDATAFAVGGGRAVTVAHVLRAGRPVLVAARRATVVQVDRRLDVAVLAIGDGRAPAARAGSVRAGDRVTVRVVRGGAVRSLHATVRRTITAR